MTKQRLIRVVALTMAFAMVLAMAGCTNGTGDTTGPSEITDMVYTVAVTNRAGTGLSKCAVEIYSDSSMTTMVYKGIANANGEVSFMAPVSDDYVAVVSKVPNGYDLATMYPLAGERTHVLLEPAVLDEALIESMLGDDSQGEKNFKLGDAMPDFEVTLTDGAVIKLSDLLKDKKAVVLNFWFMNCAPCKMEFPYLQEGYEQLSDDIALLALNPVDSTDEDIAQFQSNNGYTFTMSKCDPRWQNLLKLQLFPTTVIIDRYGNICLIHSSSIESTDQFLGMVKYFIQDDYEQQFFKSAGQVPAVTD